MKKQPNTEVIQSRISPEFKLRLENYCFKNDITEAALIRKIVCRFLTNYENRMKKPDPFTDTSDLSELSVKSEKFEI